MSDGTRAEFEAKVRRTLDRADGREMREPLVSALLAAYDSATKELRAERDRAEARCLKLAEAGTHMTVERDLARRDRDRLAALLREAVHELRRIENEARRESIPESSDAWYVAGIGEGDMECIRVLLARIAQGGE